MDATEVLEILSRDSWGPPFDAAEQARAVASLEGGRVISLPLLPFVLEEEEKRFLDASALDNSRKNISLDPHTVRVHGSGLDGDDLARLTAMIDRFARQADALVRGLFPGYAGSIERARTSFRPAEIAGREYSPPRV